AKRGRCRPGGRLRILTRRTQSAYALEESTMTRKLDALIVLGCIGLFWAALSGAQESTYDVVKKRGTLVAGVKNDYPPFGYMDADTKWVGIEVDMAKYIAD